jgi:hypothetical protein
MRAALFLALVGVASCSSTPTAGEVMADLEDMKTCSTTGDCVFAGSACGLNCGLFVARDRLDDARELIDSYEPPEGSSCARCEPMKVSCGAGECVAEPCLDEEWDEPYCVR